MQDRKTIGRELLEKICGESVDDKKLMGTHSLNLKNA